MLCSVGFELELRSLFISLPGCLQYFIIQFWVVWTRVCKISRSLGYFLFYWIRTRKVLKKYENYFSYMTPTKWFYCVMTDDILNEDKKKLFKNFIDKCLISFNADTINFSSEHVSMTKRICVVDLNKTQFWVTFGDPLLIFRNDTVYWCITGPQTHLFSTKVSSINFGPWLMGEVCVMKDSKLA